MRHLGTSKFTPGTADAQDVLVMVFGVWGWQMQTFAPLIGSPPKNVVVHSTSSRGAFSRGVAVLFIHAAALPLWA